MMIAIVCNAQTVLQNLMEGVAQQLDDLAEKEPTCKEPIKEFMRPNVSRGGFGKTQSFGQYRQE